ncbi:MAG: quercetin 2,3-dioxygenase [Bdellovibrio sp. 28-41-41]|nr:MAG: quercetin 2,3-dioxygenase [Bdellovibrio sp. 28-41-41]
MITVRKSNDRGLAEHGWLKSRHTFSFAEYYDPEFMGFGSLRVINEDRIQGGTGFGTHPHKDMEIISYVISGALQHKDSMGNVAVIKPGEIQRMSAGTGVAHSEYNDEKSKETHFFQIWISPDHRGGKPGYGQKSFEKELTTQKIVHVISKDGRDGSISINQDANMYISRLKKSEALDYKLNKGRKLWIQLIKGTVKVNDNEIETGDAIAAIDIGTVKIEVKDDSEMIIFDLV